MSPSRHGGKTNAKSCTAASPLDVAKCESCQGKTALEAAREQKAVSLILPVDIADHKAESRGISCVADTTDSPLSLSLAPTRNSRRPARLLTRLLTRRYC